ncbi:HAD family phosphatase [Lentzea sp. NPDC051208]|uniref:HAD family hydrolase n=1 Tax=Lentzea sp. NPDC051208 TaxID=3154642 RepID=UPI003439C830
MTSNRLFVDDQAKIRRVLLDADALLLDFDGPICSVFAGFPAPAVAEQLREILAGGGHSDLPDEIQTTGDPFDVLSFAANLGDDEALYTEAALRAHEVEAVATAEPTMGAHDLIRQWHSNGRKLAIVSNNSATAIEAYLHHHELKSYIDYVSARTDPNPFLLKPSPFLLHQAANMLGLATMECVLLGDSLTDIQAAQTAQMPVIGYANKPEKVDLFIAENPSAITTTIDLLAILR